MQMVSSATCMTPRSAHIICVLSLLATLLATTTIEAATVLAQQGDASVSQDPAAGTWTLRAGGASLKLALDPSHDFAIVSLLSASGTEWIAGAAADSTVRIGG